MAEQTNVIPATSIPGEEAIEGINTAVSVLAAMPIRLPDLVVEPIANLVTDDTANMTSLIPDPATAPGTAKRGKIIWEEQNIFLEEDRGDLAESSSRILSTDVVIGHFGSATSLDRKREFQPLEIRRVVNWMAANPDKDGNTRRRRLWDLLIEGNTSNFGLAHDDQTFFDTDHPAADRSGAAITQSNLFDGNLALNSTNLTTIINAMEVFKDGFGARRVQPHLTPEQTPNDDRNRLPFTASPWHLYVGGSNRQAAQDLTRVSADVPGAFANRVTFDVVPEITELTAPADNGWFVRRKGELTPLTFVSEPTRTDTDEDIELDKFRWFYRSAWAYAYRFWWTMAYAVHA